ncbi:MAG: DUF1800 family protein, partial [Verrucomicrobiota bacterium]
EQGLDICGYEYLSEENRFDVTVHVPAGYLHAILEVHDGVGGWEVLIGGRLNGSAAEVTFRVAEANDFRMVRVRAGTDYWFPTPPRSGDEVYGVHYGLGRGEGSVITGNGGPGSGVDGEDGTGTGVSCVLNLEQQIGHVLNRLAYGPSPEDVQQVSESGVGAYIRQQLDPESVSDFGNTALESRVSALFEPVIPKATDTLIPQRVIWKYRKGTSAPAANWREVGFSDLFWESGTTGIGYGDNDDVTVLEDMRRFGNESGYLTICMRKRFEVSDPAALGQLILNMVYDDGFVAYLNGEEVARSNVTGTTPAFDQVASVAGGNVDQSDPGQFVLGSAAELLQPGSNVLAIQVHNSIITSSDLSADPWLTYTTEPIENAIGSLHALQDLMHVRGIYSRRQLKSVMGEFWENHFTTDGNKVEEKLFEISSGAVAGNSLLEDQIEREAARAEFEEYDFFYENGLGNFGDLLLYSASSPPMLIYLDNILNRKAEPNENYAREILELYGFGADNRYTQTDIEELARCFTGWTLKKTLPENRLPFPASVRTPDTAPSLEVEQESEVISLGAGWRYFKGRSEPSPEPDGSPGLAWTLSGFSDQAWASGSTGLGYGDGDDATILTDMRYNYVSVYLRRPFVVSSPDAIDDLVLELSYDDGYVAYLNGTEIGRSYSMRDGGVPPVFDRLAQSLHEASEGPDLISLTQFSHLLKPAPEENILAIQVHNFTIDSSDLSLAPRILARNYSPTSVAPDDPRGVWTFRFDPAEHDTGEKTLFAGTSWERVIPADRTGAEGVQDAVEIIDHMVSHPSTSEFIVIKLVNKFVSDEITLDTYHERTADEALLDLVDGGIEAWYSTNPPGHIATVLEKLFDPDDQANAFWSAVSYRNKIKSSIEFINSACRALGGEVINGNLRIRNEEMGMTLFEREDPDGYPESGVEWMDTLSLLERIKYCQAVAANERYGGIEWDLEGLMTDRNLGTIDEVLDYFDSLIFHGHLTHQRRGGILNFANRDDAQFPSPADDLTGGAREERFRKAIGLMLSAPEFQFQ